MLKASPRGLAFFITMKHFILLIACLSGGFLKLVAQSSELKFPILFWNVENLFDTKNDSLKLDDEFTPKSLKHWTNYRYHQKLKNLSRVLIAANKWNPPALIGLCEVENDSVIGDLIRYTGLKNFEYKFIVTESKDLRGIDVALLYQSDLFRLIFHESIDVGILPTDHRPTRDILHVAGLVASGDTLDVFIAHFPSRMGGQRKSNANRVHVSRILKHHTDDVIDKRLNPLIIIMGDFNDFPSNESVQKILGVKSPSTEKTLSRHTLYHLLMDSRRQKEWGTYKYKNRWDVLDHFIVSGSLLDSSKSCYTSLENTQIVRLPFHIIHDEKYGGTKPFRTYNGMHYLGGYSDHLPIVSTFIIRLD